jgi:hypothetical protein
MPRVDPLQSDFSGGEYSPLVYGRVDSARYRQGLKTCINYFPTIQGGLMRRSGTKYVAEVKTSSLKTRLIPFEFSTTQAYILEFGNQYFRIYKDNAQVQSGGSAVEVATPYLTADLFDIRFTQSADVLYMVHPDYAPRKIERTSDTAWTISIIDFLDGPYLPLNTSATTITPGGTTGTVTLTASTSIFNSTDVGTDFNRRIRLKFSTTQTWAEIVSYTSGTVVSAVIRGQNLPGTSAITNWRLGLWSDTTGYPSVVQFHENRLTFANNAEDPQRFDMSISDDYENFAPDDVFGTTTTVLDTSAVAFSLVSRKVNAVRWLASTEQGLAAGTVGGEWIIRPSTEGLAISPTNVSAKQMSSYGNADVEPVQVGDIVLFTQRAKRKLRRLVATGADKFIAPDMSIISEHITETGIVEMDHQVEPQSIVWMVLTDGKLVGMTYEETPDGVQVGWHKHIIGGQSDAAGSDALVESVAVIPSSDATRSETWIIVKREVDGATVRYIEYITADFTDDVDQQDAFFVDSGLTLDNPVTVSGITQANPAVVTANSHGFTNGDKVLFKEVVGMTEVNDETYLVANSTTHTFELTDLSGTNIDSTSFSAYVSGGEVRKLVTNISGLDHLEGESVDILADGAVQAAKTVASGAITLDTAAAVVHVGLGYQSQGQMLRLEAGSATGTSLGKTRRIHRVGFLLHRSLGLKLGPSLSDLTIIPFRSSSAPMTRAPALFSGIKSETVDFNYDFENYVSWQQDQPLPSTILAIMPQMKTEDRG